MNTYHKIVFLRHLRTLNNDCQIISGQSDSKVVSHNCVELDLKKFDDIYCSPSPRCRETLKIMNEHDPDLVNVIYDTRLLERDMGCLEGMTRAEAQDRYSDLFTDNRFNVFKTPPDGESFEIFENRVREFYVEKLCKTRNQYVLVCSHNQTLRLLRLMILKKSVTCQSWLEYSFDNGQPIFV